MKSTMLTGISSGTSSKSPSVVGEPTGAASNLVSLAVEEHARRGQYSSARRGEDQVGICRLRGPSRR